MYIASLAALERRDVIEMNLAGSAAVVSLFERVVAVGRT